MHSILNVAEILKFKKDEVYSMIKRMRFYKVSYEYTYNCNNTDVKDTRAAYIAINVTNDIRNFKNTDTVLKSVLEDVYKNDLELSGIAAHDFNITDMKFLVDVNKYNNIKFTNKVLMTEDYIFIM